MSKWNFVRLDEICDLEKGKTGLLKAKEGKYPLVATGKDRRTCDTYQFDAKAVCIPLVSSTGHGHASLKYVHYQEGKFALGTILVAVIPKDENIVNAQFLHLYLSRLKDIILVPLMTGAANVTLTVTKLKTVKVPLPDIKEQLRIVSLFNRMDNEQVELINEISTQQTLLKKLRQSILQEAIEGKLTASWREQNPDVESASVLLEKIKAEKEQLIKEKKIKKQKPLPPISEDEMPFDIPDGWEWCRIGEIIRLTDNLNIQAKLNMSEIINYVDIDAINNTTFTIDNIKIKPVKELSSRARRILKKDYIVYSTVRPYLNNITIIRDEIKNFIGSTGFMVFQPINVLNKYFFFLLLSPYIEKYYLTLIGDFNSPSITNDEFFTTYFPLPSLEEQKEIVKKIENLFKICDELEEQINSSKINSQTLMQAVLKEAFENNA